MKKIIFFILGVLCFNPSHATIHVITVWSGYYQFIDSNFNNLNTNTLIIQLGDTVQWLPLDPPTESHTITSTTIPTGSAAFDVMWQLPADTFFQYIPQVTGIYNFECTPHAISWNMKGTIDVQPSTGIAENQLQTIISVYPNPFSSLTTLQTDNLLYNATLTVDNCFGQTVKQIKNINGQTVTLSCDNLASGLYFVRLTEENKTIAVDKLVITDK